MKQLFTLFLFSLIVTTTYAQDVVSIRGTVEMHPMTVFLKMLIL